jgi:uncharacterized protein
MTFELQGAASMFDPRKRKQRQVTRFLELVVNDALEAPLLAVGRTRGRRRTTPMHRPDGSVVCEHCFVADSPLSRMRGLLGVDGLEPGEGVLLRPAGSIHTAFMRFAIDVVFLDRSGTVVKVSADVAPWRSRSARRARAVLELRAGECARRRIVVGDILQVAS